METMDVSVSEAIRQIIFGYGATIIVSALAAGLIWTVVYVLDSLHHRKQAAAAPKAVTVNVAPEPPKVDETAHHVAAIAAAVYTAIGSARLVYIGETTKGTAWTQTGRTLHQVSHMPKRAPKQ